MKKLNTILLIDDNKADNRFHKMIIEEMDIAGNIKTAENGLEALNYLKDNNNSIPELIFLDLGMPVMDGWEFLKEYKKLDRVKKANPVLIILSSAKESDLINKAPEVDEVHNFELKPLTKRAVSDILRSYFK